jgi:hypothetical protein
MNTGSFSGLDAYLLWKPAQMLTIDLVIILLLLISDYFALNMEIILFKSDILFDEGFSIIRLSENILPGYITYWIYDIYDNSLYCLGTV